jgi:L-2-hydroxyglutarate oxidase
VLSVHSRDRPSTTRTAIEERGKLIVAATPVEVQRRADLVTLEPRIAGLAALLVPSAGIVDYRRVALAEGEPIRAGQLIACAGLQADRLARSAGLNVRLRIIPFRGEYFRLPTTKSNVVRHLIYPVPDPELPFLGVHLTRMIGGHVTVGPNAVLGFAREGPEFTLQDLRPYPAGIRAQAVLADGTLVHDFMFAGTPRMVHVLNAPSPAATAALPIARVIAARALHEAE